MTTISDIRRIVCQRYGVSFVDLDSRRNDRITLEARHLAMWLARHVTPMSLPEIGKKFGGRDQSTVRAAIFAVEKRGKADPIFGREARLLRQVLMPMEPGPEAWQAPLPGIHTTIQ
jgi:chromosomal replication initiator protein